MAKRKPNIPAWKSYENLVALIERLLVGVKATITADDNIADRYGKKRQVDVSVRIDTGTSQLLIIFECRNRGRGSDVTWIEQVCTKKDNLRADRAIVVSNKSLSGAAQQMARDKGIEIRSLREIDKSLLPLMFPSKMESKSVTWHTEKIVVYPTQKPENDDWYQDLQTALQMDDQAVRMEFPDGQTFNLREIRQKVTANLDTFHLPPNVDRYEYKVEVLPPNLTAKLTYGRHKVIIHRAVLSVIAVVKTAEPMHSFFGDYISDTNQVDHLIAQTGIERDGNPINFSAIGKRGEDKFRINIPYEFLDENIRKEVDPKQGITLEIAKDDAGNLQGKADRSRIMTAGLQADASLETRKKAWETRRANAAKSKQNETCPLNKLRVVKDLDQEK